MARSKVRFGLLAASIALLVFLILFQQALRDGLLTSFVGAIEHQSAPVLVYSTDGRRTLQSTSVPPELEAEVRAVDGVGAVARIGQSTVSVEADDRIQGAAVIGYERRALGAPEDLVAGRFPTGEGEAVANESDAGDGFAIGDTVRVEPGGATIRIVGQARDVNLQASPTLFVRYSTWEEAVAAANADARTPLPNALGVSPAPGTSDDELVRRINAISPELEALTRADAAAKSPGVAQVSRSFLLIFLLYGSVVPLVIGVFFLIVTVQKARTLTLLRAIGARERTLVGGLVLQVVIVVLLGVALGTALFLPVSQQRIGSIALQFDAVAVVAWGALILTLGVASALFAARRIRKLEPAAALAGGTT